MAGWAASEHRSLGRGRGGRLPTELQPSSSLIVGGSCTKFAICAHRLYPPPPPFFFFFFWYDDDNGEVAAVANLMATAILQKSFPFLILVWL